MLCLGVGGEDHHRARRRSGLLGLDELTEHDRYAPLLPDEHKVSWDEARDIVLDSYGSFSGQMADIVRGFFGRYIDAPPAPGKQGRLAVPPGRRRRNSTPPWMTPRRERPLTGHSFALAPMAAAVAPPSS